MNKALIIVAVLGIMALGVWFDHSMKKARAVRRSLTKEELVKQSEDNTPGLVRHLYVLSYTGKVLMHSTVRGNVMSGGKRVATIKENGGRIERFNGYMMGTNGAPIPTELITQEVADNLTEFVYWWDIRDNYHQHYVTSGQILHISGRPLEIKDIAIDMEVAEVQ